jgi:hypothetical protein
MTTAYTVFAGCVLAALTWIHFTGWSPGTVSEEKVIPTSVRDNPGSYRSTYGRRPYTGAK